MAAAAPEIGAQRQNPLAVSYKDDNDNWPTLQARLRTVLPLRDIVLRNNNATNKTSTQNQLISQVELDFVPCERSIVPNTRVKYKWYQLPYLNLFLVRGDVGQDLYKSTIRGQIRAWLDLMVQAELEWLIVCIEATSKTVKNRVISVLGQSVFNKIQQDFKSNDKIERVVSVRDAGGDDTDLLDGLLPRMKEGLVAGFNKRVAQYQSQLALEDTRMTVSGWNFNSYFTIKEGLALVYEKFTLYNDCLEIYTGLLRLYEQSTDSQRGQPFGDLRPQDARTSLKVAEKPYSTAIYENTISEFDFRQYVFGRRFELLFHLKQALVMAEEGLEYVRLMTQRLKAHMETLPQNFIETFVFYTCVRILSACKTVAKARFEKSEKYRFAAYKGDLTALARRKLAILGHAQGLLPGASLADVPEEIALGRAGLQRGTLTRQLSVRLLPLNLEELAAQGLGRDEHEQETHAPDEMEFASDLLPEGGEVVVIDKEHGEDGLIDVESDNTPRAAAVALPANDEDAIVDIDGDDGETTGDATGDASAAARGRGGAEARMATTSTADGDEGGFSSSGAAESPMIASGDAHLRTPGVEELVISPTAEAEHGFPRTSTPRGDSSTPSSAIGIATGDLVLGAPSGAPGEASEVAGSPQNPTLGVAGDPAQEESYSEEEGRRRFFTDSPAAAPASPGAGVGTVVESPMPVDATSPAASAAAAIDDAAIELQMSESEGDQAGDEATTHRRSNSVSTPPTVIVTPDSPARRTQTMSAAEFSSSSRVTSAAPTPESAAAAQFGTSPRLVAAGGVESGTATVARRAVEGGKSRTSTGKSKRREKSGVLDMPPSIARVHRARGQSISQRRNSLPPDELAKADFLPVDRLSAGDQERFDKLYRDLNEEAKSSYERCHYRERFVTQLLGDEAYLNYVRGRYTEAALVCEIVCKSYADEQWNPLKAAALACMAECHWRQRNLTQYASACLHLAGSTFLSEEQRLWYQKEMMSTATTNATAITHAIDANATSFLAVAHGPYLHLPKKKEAEAAAGVAGPSTPVKEEKKEDKKDDKEKEHKRKKKLPPQPQPRPPPPTPPTVTVGTPVQVTCVVNCLFGAPVTFDQVMLEVTHLTKDKPSKSRGALKESCTATGVTLHPGPNNVALEFVPRAVGTLMPTAMEFRVGMVHLHAPLGSEGHVMAVVPSQPTLRAEVELAGGLLGPKLVQALHVVLHTNEDGVEEGSVSIASPTGLELTGYGSATVAVTPAGQTTPRTSSTADMMLTSKAQSGTRLNTLTAGLCQLPKCAPREDVRLIIPVASSSIRAHAVTVEVQYLKPTGETFTVSHTATLPCMTPMRVSHSVDRLRDNPHATTLLVQILVTSGVALQQNVLDCELAVNATTGGPAKGVAVRRIGPKAPHVWALGGFTTLCLLFEVDVPHTGGEWACEAKLTYERADKHPDSPASLYGPYTWIYGLSLAQSPCDYAVALSIQDRAPRAGQLVPFRLHINSTALALGPSETASLRYRIEVSSGEWLVVGPNSVIFELKQGDSKTFMGTVMPLVPGLLPAPTVQLYAHRPGPLGSAERIQCEVMGGPVSVLPALVVHSVCRVEDE